MRILHLAQHVAQCNTSTMCNVTPAVHVNPICTSVQHAVQFCHKSNDSVEETQLHLVGIEDRSIQIAMCTPARRAAPRDSRNLATSRINWSQDFVKSKNGGENETAPFLAAPLRLLRVFRVLRVTCRRCLPCARGPWPSSRRLRSRRRRLPCGRWPSFRRRLRPCPCRCPRRPPGAVPC